MADKRKIIYGLVDPRNNKLRYIGKSCSGLTRPRQHTRPSDLVYDTPKVNWIKELINQYLKPKIIIIQECFSHDELNEREDYWIKYYKNECGFELVNSCWGGKGTPGYKHTEEYKKLMSEKMKIISKDRELSEGMIKRKEHITENDQELKICSSCNEILLLNNFYKLKSTWDGLDWCCKKCNIARSKRYKDTIPKLTEEELKNSYLKRAKKIAESLNKESTKMRLKEMNQKKIEAQNLTTNETKVFDSLTIFAREVNGSSSGACTAMKKNRPYKGYRLKYI